MIHIKRTNKSDFIIKGNNLVIRHDKVGGKTITIVNGVDVTNEISDEKEINIFVTGDIESCDVDIGNVSVTGNVNEVKTRNGNIKVGNDVLGDAKTTNGNISANVIKGSAKTTNGNIRG